MKLAIAILAVPLMCGGCVLQGTPSGGLAIDPAFHVMREHPHYSEITPEPPSTYAPAYIPPPPAYAPPGAPYPPSNTYGLPDWTPNQ